jgi:hypothetical protein
MAQKSRGKSDKRVAKSKKVPSRTAHTPEAPLPLNARLRSLAPSAAEMSSGLTEPVVVPEPVSIAPTIYPHDPGGTITVQNYITINTRKFRAFEDKMSQLLAEMGKSNVIAGEVRDKLNAEIGAGMTILKSPKPDRRVIEVWLLQPLCYIADKALGAVTGKLAASALVMLIKMIG